MQTVQLQGYSGLGAATDLSALAESIADMSSWSRADAIAVAAAGMSETERAEFAQALVIAGVPASNIESGMIRAGDQRPYSLPKGVKAGITVWGVLATLSAAASGYHGYRRNDSLGWGLWWFLMGSIFPVVTPTVAVAQGFGKPKR